MLRFAAAALIAAFVVLSADRYGEGLFVLGIVAANYVYKAFTWACMAAAVFIATPAPRYWPNVLVCGLALAVGFIQARELAIMTVANGQTPVFWWITTLAMFALPLWLIWLWYKRVNVARPKA